MKSGFDNLSEQEIRQLVKKEIQEEKQRSQYNVSRVPVHVHNGLDAPKVDFVGGLANRQVLITSHIVSTEAAASGNYGHFFNNLFGVNVAAAVFSATNGIMRFVAMTEVHGRAGNDAGTVSLNLAVLREGDASLSGGTVIAGPFNLKGTANNVQYAAPLFGTPPPFLYPGDRLALQTSGTLTNVADVLVTVLLQY